MFASVHTSEYADFTGVARAQSAYAMSQIMELPFRSVRGQNPHDRRPGVSQALSRLIGIGYPLRGFGKKSQPEDFSCNPNTTQTSTPLQPPSAK
jgi:hypothetical protein